MSGFLPSPTIKIPFEDERPAYTATRDPAGYVNLPYETDQEFDVLLAGDSYMTTGVTPINQIIANELGQPVLNRAVLGRGPFVSVLNYLDANDIRHNPGAWLVWGFIEREIFGPKFSGFVYQLSIRKETEGPAPAQFSIIRHHLSPAKLRQDLPNTSILAQKSRNVWAQIRYHGWGALPPEIFKFQPIAPSDAPILGYREALNAIYTPPEERRVCEAVESVRIIRDFLSKQGLRLLVVPIPDKEQIYRDRIPASEWSNGQPPPPSILPEFIDGLRVAGIDCVDLYSPFSESSARGSILYWRDDTHWNDEGIVLAAAEIARFIKNHDQTAQQQ